MSSRLSYLVRSESSKRVYTVQVLKELGVTLAAANFFVLNDLVNTIEFNSYKLGVTKFSLIDKKFYGNLWETENDAKAISNLNYHYTSIGLDAVANDDSNTKIFKLVLEIINDSTLIKIIEKTFGHLEISENEIEEYFDGKCL